MFLSLGDHDRVSKPEKCHQLPRGGTAQTNHKGMKQNL